MANKTENEVCKEISDAMDVIDNQSELVRKLIRLLESKRRGRKMPDTELIKAIKEELGRLPLHTYTTLDGEADVTTADAYTVVSIPTLSLQEVAENIADICRKKGGG